MTFIGPTIDARPRKGVALTTAFDLEDELTLEESGWRGRAITFGVLILVAAFAAAAAWYFFFNESEATARPTEDITVARTTISSTLLISGVAEAQLSSDLLFQTSGKVGTVDVKVGDTVRQGQVLATLESEDLVNAISVAETNQRTAQLKLEDLLDGSSNAEVATAEQALAQADAAWTKAANDYQTLLNGATGADLAAAQGAVSLAEAQLATARSTREKLATTPGDADVAAAAAGVALAESALTAAENSADSAENSVTSAEASLKSAETSYCSPAPPAPVPDFCSSLSAPISVGDAGKMDAALDGDNSTEAASVITANNAFLNAENSAESAEAAVESAADSLDSAEAKLQALEDGPSSEEIAAADAGVASAEAGLASAQAKLADAQDGPDALDIASAQAAVDSAEAAVFSAEARLDEAFRGPETNTIAQAREAMRSASLSVEAASIRLRNAQIVAPFDGTVAAVSIAAGEFASQAAQEPAIVLLTPDSVQLIMDVGETDYGNVKKDQGGVVLFDGLPGAVYPFTITEIGLSPTINQGVVTYQVKASLVILPNSPRPAPGMNGRGRVTTDSKPDILTVPPRAVRPRGAEQVVDIRRNGTIEEQVVTTGLTDPENIEILTGVSEGDVLVVPSLTTAADDEAEAVPTLAGGVR